MAAPEIPVPFKVEIFSSLTPPIATTGMDTLRDKHLGEEELLREAKDMKALAAAYHVPFIINDNVELALAIDADGVHVGQEDMEAGTVSDGI